MRFIFGFFFFLPFCLLAQRPATFDSLLVVHTDTIYFDSGKWDILPESDTLLQSFITKLNDQSKVYLTGHTDDIGSFEFNEQLAIKRAQSIAAHLAELGADTREWVIQTFGERSPVERNNSDQSRQKNRRVTLAIFQPAAYTRLLGKVINPIDEEPIHATLRIHSRSFSDTIHTNELGQFETFLPVDTVVGVEVYAPGYFYHSQFLKVKREGLLPLTISLPKATAGESIDIPNLYFYGSKAVLLPRSAPELPKIKRFLEINPSIKIEIAGHVNYPNKPPVTEDTFEWNLAERRAKMIYDWLLDQGVSAEQITHQGYGNHYMRFPNARSEREQELNRRVEIKVLETGEVISIEEKE